MTDKIFEVLEEINTQGIENHLWGLIENENTSYFDFCIEDVWQFELKGKWLYVYSDNFQINANADIEIITSKEEKIKLYCLD